MPIRMSFCERDLARARYIFHSWTPRKKLSSDEVDIIVRMIAQGIAGGRREGLEMAESERLNAERNHRRRDGLTDDLSAKL